MVKNTITLTESEFKELVENCVNDMIEEGIFDQLGAAWKGAKQGFKGQKTLDRGTDDFKNKHDMSDYRREVSGKSVENTAQEQAKYAYEQYRAYQEQANKMLNLYKRLIKQYNLEKISPGKFKEQEPIYVGNTQMKRSDRLKNRTNMPNPGTRGQR